MIATGDTKKCSECIAVKPLNRYVISSTGLKVVTLFCRKWGTYVHEHDAEKCLDFIVGATA